MIGQTKEGETTGGRQPSPAVTGSLRDVLAILFKRKWLILAFLAGVSVITLVTVFQARPEYQITASLIVKSGRAQIPLGPKDTQQVILSQVREEDLNSEIAIVGSRDVLESALREVGPPPAQPPSKLDLLLSRFQAPTKEEGDGSVIDGLVLQVQKQIEIVPVTRSNIIQISYPSTDIDWATQFIDALTLKYIEQRSRILQTPGTISFFEEQMDASRKKLEEAEGAFESYLSEAGVTPVQQGPDSLAVEKELLLNELGRMEQDLSQSRAHSLDLEQKLLTLRSQLAVESERLPSASIQNQNAAVQELERALVALELERDDLLQKYAPSSKLVTDVNEQIRLAQARLDVAEERLQGINRTELNLAYQQLKSNLGGTEAELRGSEARTASLERQVFAMRSDVKKLNEHAISLAKLRRDLNIAEEAFLLYQRKFEEARISAAMDERGLVDVSIAQPARAPLTPLGVGRKMKLLAGLLLGFAGGIALAMAAEYVDHTLATATDMEQRLGIPHLASIPDEG